MKLTFWGVRGSIPTPEPHAIGVGGNTSCVSVQVDDHVVIFDAGTGLRNLGQYLEDKDRSQWKGSILLSHYHWDHIQGLPFFEPAYREQNRFHIYGKTKHGNRIEDILAEQMESPFFPVDMDSLEGLVTFEPVEEGKSLSITPNVKVLTIGLNHPNGAIGYRLEHPTGSISYICDHEHPAKGLDPAVIEFVRNTTVLIHDSQYMPLEKKGSKSGWGHSSWEEAVLTAKAAGVNRLFLYHHDPTRTDSELLALLSDAKKIFNRVEIAKESQEYKILKGAIHPSNK
jgi:phosphoribosyl 1,2-cyclic phosphodiesterase